MGGVAGGGALQTDPPLNCGSIKALILHVPSGKRWCFDQQAGALILAFQQRQVTGDKGVGPRECQTAQGLARLSGYLLVPLGIEPRGDSVAFDIRC